MIQQTYLFDLAVGYEYGAHTKHLSIIFREKKNVGIHSCIFGIEKIIDPYIDPCLV